MFLARLNRWREERRLSRHERIVAEGRVLLEKGIPTAGNVVTAMAFYADHCPTKSTRNSNCEIQTWKQGFFSFEVIDGHSCSSYIVTVVHPDGLKLRVMNCVGIDGMHNGGDPLLEGPWSPALAAAALEMHNAAAANKEEVTKWPPVLGDDAYDKCAALF